jgi:hypothetical protein
MESFDDQGEAAQRQYNQERGYETGNWGMEKTAKERVYFHDCLKKARLLTSCGGWAPKVYYKLP